MLMPGSLVSAGSRRMVDGITMFIVTGLSLLLLVYVGVGEGKRTYEQLEIEKLISQGRHLQTSIENNLRAGLPLKQFAGFSTIADGIVNGLEEVDAIVVYDQTGHQLFIALDKKNPKLPQPSSAIKRVKQTIELDKSDTHTQVILPLRSRFETVGSLVVMASRDGLAKRLSSNFRPLLFVVLVLTSLFAIVVWVMAPYIARTRTPWLQIGYALTFLVMAGAVVATLVTLYSEAVQAKIQASALTLSQRLSDVVEFNLKFEHIEGVEKIFRDYRRLNPEINEAALVVEGIVQISADPKKVGKPWVSDSRNFEYDINLSRSNKSRVANLVVTAPTAVVYDQVERSVRNFAALFVASAFLAGLFLQVASSMQRLRMSGGQSANLSDAKSNEEAGLIIVKPVFFLAVFLEHLLYSFLPKFMQDVASDFGLLAGICSGAFHGLLSVLRSQPHSCWPFCGKARPPRPDLGWFDLGR